MLKLRSIVLLHRRWKSGAKKRWNVLQNKKNNCDRALENFDDFYGSVYGSRWKNMRAALLTRHKYIALVNNFGDTEQTSSMLEMDGAINMKSLINLAQDRLKESSNEPMPAQGQSRHEIEGKLDTLLRKQQEREVSSIYPSLGEDGLSGTLPQQLKFDNIEEKQTDQLQERLPFEQSLTKALEEDVRLDENRLVDPQFGTGGLYEYMPALSIKGMEDCRLDKHIE
ncbi:uncharacterized protein [Drosophila bipectinata]|uniref:uncharacterized protein n=1 Tax=Drosophila bipectinata TaxID=42026 RepID=UPI001C8A2C6B|nr:uncharacterized protein LOC108132202 [Drosophila bipectinata]